MKPNYLFPLFLLALVGTIGGCVSAPPTIVSKDYELFGTWVNPEYESHSLWFAKVMCYPNGHMDFYSLVSDAEATHTAEFAITGKWVDQDGQHWYTFRISHAKNLWWYALGMIESTGQAMHWTSVDTDYPTQLDLDLPSRNPGYRYYMRQ